MMAWLYMLWRMWMGEGGFMERDGGFGEFVGRGFVHYALMKYDIIRGDED